MELPIWIGLFGVQEPVNPVGHPLLCCCNGAVRGLPIQSTSTSAQESPESTYHAHSVGQKRIIDNGFR